MWPGSLWCHVCNELMLTVLVVPLQPLEGPTDVPHFPVSEVGRDWVPFHGFDRMTHAWWAVLHSTQPWCFQCCGQRRPRTGLRQSRSLLLSLCCYFTSRASPGSPVIPSFTAQ